MNTASGEVPGRCGDPMEQGVACEAVLPLSWQAVAELPPEQRLAALNGANEALVRSCDGLEEPQRLLDESGDVAQELQRMDAKLNLLLELLAERLRPDGLPPERVLRFNARGMCWESPEVPPGGTLLRLECYLCARIPRPLVLFGRVVDSHALQDGGSRAVVEFLGLSSGLVDALERLVFRRHRREVAQLRGQRRGTE